MNNLKLRGMGSSHKPGHGENWTLNFDYEGTEMPGEGPFYLFCLPEIEFGSGAHRLDRLNGKRF